MKISILIDVVIAISLILVCVKLAKVSNSASDDKATSESETSTPAIENIMTRSSVRAYTSEAVTDSAIQTLLKAGMAAPTAVDKRPWHFVVVTNKERLASIADKMPNAKMAASAPLAIVVCGNMEKALPDQPSTQYWIQDCSAATENILLAAHAIGLGAVWCGVTPIEERIADTRSILNLPEHLIPLGIVVIGHPQGTPRIKDKWNPADITYVK